MNNGSSTFYDGNVMTVMKAFQKLGKFHSVCMEDVRIIILLQYI